MDAITVLPMTGFYDQNTMEEETEMTDIEKWEEQQNDLGDYPDGFDPGLYDL